jgi:hypothetical protein
LYKTILSVAKWVGMLMKKCFEKCHFNGVVRF